MLKVTLRLHSDIERALREKARLSGLSLETYLQELAERDAAGGNGSPPSPPTAEAQSLDEFERQLDELSAGLPALPILPAALSRADVYGEHD
jgi:hypothetical protein